MCFSVCFYPPKCIPASVLPNTFLFFKCISDVYHNVFINVFQYHNFAVFAMCPSICISKYFREYFCLTLTENKVKQSCYSTACKHK
uniref:Uncharacterized protein n=1 Tax=Ixodes ricinus TaxID=34613 RepID=A0A6B0UB04_IXORI